MSAFFKRLFSNKPLMTKLLLTLAALVFLGVCLIIYFTIVVPPADSGIKDITLEIEYSDAVYTYKIRTEQNYVDQMLEEVNEEFDLKVKHTGIGPDYFITSMKDTDTPSDWSYYYVFFIDGKGAELGASATPLKTGATYSFKFASVSYGPAPEFAIKIESLGKCNSGAAGAKGSNVPKTELIFFVSAAGVLVIAAAAVLAVNFHKKRKLKNENAAK